MIIKSYHYSSLISNDSPVLIIQGTTDIQVRVEDTKLLSEANPQARIQLIEGMNHIFKNSTSDRQENIATYINPNLPINDKLVYVIVDFIQKLN